MGPISVSALLRQAGKTPETNALAHWACKISINTSFSFEKSMLTLLLELVEKHHKFKSAENVKKCNFYICFYV